MLAVPGSVLLTQVILHSHHIVRHLAQPEQNANLVAAPHFKEVPRCLALVLASVPIPAKLLAIPARQQKIAAWIMGYLSSVLV
jgi:hypothetical protein